MQAVVDHWRTRFDWRHWEARLNAHEQYLISLSNIDVHVLIEHGSGQDALPIILTHGWPGSVFELIELIEPLAHPERFGGAVADAFTVVEPLLFLASDRAKAIHGACYRVDNGITAG